MGVPKAYQSIVAYIHPTCPKAPNSEKEKKDCWYIPHSFQNKPNRFCFPLFSSRAKEIWL